MSIGECLRNRRAALGWSMTEASRRAGVSRPYLSMVETGRRSPGPAVLLHLTAALGVPAHTWLCMYLERERRCQQLIDLAEGLMGREEYASAARVLGRALAISRRERGGRYNADIYYVAGRLRVGQRRYAKAVGWFRLMARAGAHAKDLRRQAVANYNLGLALARAGQPLAAVGRLAEAGQGFAALHLPYETGVSVLAKANQLLELQQYEAARAAYRRSSFLLRGRSYHDDAELGQAITTWKMGDSVKAEGMLLKVIDNVSTTEVVRAKARHNLGAVLRGQSRHQDALRHLDAALALRSALPANVVGAILVEITICRVLANDRSGATKAMGEFRSLEGTKDGQDIAAMHVLATLLDVAPPEDEVPPEMEEAHNTPLSAAMELLGRALSNQEGPF